MSTDTDIGYGCWQDPAESKGFHADVGMPQQTGEIIGCWLKRAWMRWFIATVHLPTFTSAVVAAKGWRSERMRMQSQGCIASLLKMSTNDWAWCIVSRNMGLGPGWRRWLGRRDGTRSLPIGASLAQTKAEVWLRVRAFKREKGPSKA